MRDIWPRFEFNWDYYLHYQYYSDIFIYKCKSVNVNMNVYLYTIWYAWDIVVHSCSVYPTIYIYTLYIYIYIYPTIYTYTHTYDCYRHPSYMAISSLYIFLLNPTIFDIFWYCCNNFYVERNCKPCYMHFL